MCRYSRHILIVLLSILSALYLTSPPPFRSSYLSFALGFIGRWEAAKRVTQRALAELADMQMKTLTLTRQDYDDESDKVDDGEPIYELLGLDQSETTILMRLADIHYTLEEYDDAIAIYLDRVVPRLRKEAGENDLEVGLVLSTAAYIYKAKGQYDTGLDLLGQAQAVYLANDVPEDKETKSQLLRTNQDDIEDFNRLIGTMKDQAAFIEKYVEMASRWNFVGRIHSFDKEDVDIDDSTSENICPNIDLMKRDRFYSVPEIILLPSMGLILWLLVRFVWVKPTRLRCGVAASMVMPLLVPFLSYWRWTKESFTERLNFVASLQQNIGKYEKALATWDEVRCSILSSPHDEVLLSQPDLVLDTFLNPAFVYAAQLEFNVLDALVQDIDDLIKADSGQLEPSFRVFNYYLTLADAYHNTAKESHFNNLAEKEATALSKFISNQAEEGIQKILDPESGKPVNESIKILKDAEKQEKEASGPEITVEQI